jgi:hypothetical protein
MHTLTYRVSATALAFLLLSGLGATGVEAATTHHKATHHTAKKKAHKHPPAHSHKKAQQQH